MGSGTLWKTVVSKQFVAASTNAGLIEVTVGTQLQGGVKRDRGDQMCDGEVFVLTSSDRYHSVN